jgi:hypothetical protein
MLSSDVILSQPEARCPPPSQQPHETSRIDRLELHAGDRVRVVTYATTRAGVVIALSLPRADRTEPSATPDR